MIPRTSLPLIAAIALAPLPALAQDRALQFEIGLGASTAPAYEGSDEYATGPGFGAGLGRLNWWVFDVDKGDGMGFGFGPSFRVVGERDDDEYPRLTGIDDVDTAVELGAQVSYRWPAAEVFGALRMGVTGHDGAVMDMGADVVMMPAARTEFRVGPRVTLANEAYADTYFTAPTGAVLSAYDASGGVHSYGLEMSLRHDFNEDWAVKGTLGWNRLAGSMGDSPVVQERNSGTVGILLYRKFDWRW